MAGDVNTYEQGNLVRLTGEFSRSSDGQAIDPETVKFRIRAPSGQVTEYTYPASSQIVKTATGAYYVDWPADQPGRYTYRWFSIGNGMAAQDRVFVVQPAGA